MPSRLEANRLLVSIREPCEPINFMLVDKCNPIVVLTSWICEFVFKKIQCHIINTDDGVYIEPPTVFILRESYSSSIIVPIISDFIIIIIRDDSDYINKMIFYQTKMLNNRHTWPFHIWVGSCFVKKNRKNTVTYYY